MENKQGCIDWLVEEINKQKAWADPSKLEPIIQQAKAMHKEEIINAWLDESAIFDSEEKAENYYNEKFGGNNETH